MASPNTENNWKKHDLAAANLSLALINCHCHQWAVDWRDKFCAFGIHLQICHSFGDIASATGQCLSVDRPTRYDHQSPRAVFESSSPLVAFMLMCFRYKNLYNETSVGDCRQSFWGRRYSRMGDSLWGEGRLVIAWRILIIYHKRRLMCHDCSWEMCDIPLGENLLLINSAMGAARRWCKSWLSLPAAERVHFCKLLKPSDLSQQCKVSVSASLFIHFGFCSCVRINDYVTTPWLR